MSVGLFQEVQMGTYGSWIQGAGWLDELLRWTKLDEELCDIPES